MEVDLLCEEAHLVIELDGAQHLENAEAYRRDRRKDQLRQENGYFVLRFLAEDIGERLDAVLDAILRALAISVAALFPNIPVIGMRRFARRSISSSSRHASDMTSATAIVDCHPC